MHRAQSANGLLRNKMPFPQCTSCAEQLAEWEPSLRRKTKSEKNNLSMSAARPETSHPGHPAWLSSVQPFNLAKHLPKALPIRPIPKHEQHQVKKARSAKRRPLKMPIVRTSQHGKCKDYTKGNHTAAKQAALQHVACCRSIAFLCANARSKCPLDPPHTKRDRMLIYVVFPEDCTEIPRPCRWLRFRYKTQGLSCTKSKRHHGLDVANSLQVLNPISLLFLGLVLAQCQCDAYKTNGRFDILARHFLWDCLCMQEGL